MRSKRSGNGKRTETRKKFRDERKALPEFVGTVQMTREGYAFVNIEDQEEDVFVRQNKTAGALNGDKVLVKVTKMKSDGKRMEGQVKEILERSQRPFIGILHIVGAQAWVLMQSRFMPYDISIDILNADGKPVYRKRTSGKTEAPKDYTGALRPISGGEFAVKGISANGSELTVHSGMKVAAVVDSWARGEANPSGHLVDVLGEVGENDTEMHAILAEYGLPYRFEPEVENAADNISDKITEKDIKGRRDFRDTLTFTIDPIDAKDFDDALSFKALDNGNYEVGVHIADVSYYVTPGTIVDKEAQNRGTSVYLVDRTVPMLPEKLSNKLCSLRPNEEKLTFSAVFEISPKAKIVGTWFGRTIIKSDYRFAYETAQQVIDNGEKSLEMDLRGGTDGIHSKVSEPVLVYDKSKKKSKEAQAANHKASESAMGEGAFEGCVIPRHIKEAILKLWEIADIFRTQRFKSGAIGFERPEMKVEVDETGKPVRVYQKITKEANWLIEEFMLLANKAVAEFIATGGKMNGRAKKDAKTFVYRVHDEPNLLKLSGLRDFVKTFGYKTSLGEEDGKSTAEKLNSLLVSAKDKPEFNAIEMLALRSMAKAHYSTDNIGHYGLAFRFYTHFTSPIRRYPDTMVHRLLAMYLDGAKSQDKAYYEKECVYASARELIAANAERDSIKYKLVEFMLDKVGFEFEGRISGLTEWGMYVEIEPTKIEGMIALRDIKSDFFEFDEETYRIKGKSSGREFILGDQVRIRVKNANIEQRILDYELIENEIVEEPKPKGNKEARKAKIKAAIKASKKSKTINKSKK